MGGTKGDRGGGGGCGGEDDETYLSQPLVRLVGTWTLCVVASQHLD